MWSLEKLKDWARPALRYEELIEIARTAPSAKQAKNRALEFARNSGLEEEEAEKLAKACRWLMIIRRNYGPEAQEEYITSAREGMSGRNQKPKPEEKEMGERVKITLLHDGIKLDMDGISAVRTCNEILAQLAAPNKIIERFKILPEFTNGWMTQNDFRNLMIQILEEKYGFKIKVCGNCGHFEKKKDGYDDIRLDKGDRVRRFQGSCQLLPTYERGAGRDADEHREHCWVPPKEKEVPEKKKKLPPGGGGCPHDPR